MPRSSARSYAFLSLAAAIATIALKLVSYWVTGSVGLLSDAIESFINLVAAAVAIWALTVSVRPPDDEHAFGHTKAEYFASGAEGLLILVAALGIGVTAYDRLLHPRELGQVWLGLSISVVASVVNGATAVILMRAGRRLRSITLTSDARHLLTDVWTTGGVLIGVGLVELTGWLPLDPLVAMLVAVNIAWTGIRLLLQTGHGVLDSAVPKEDRDAIEEILAGYTESKLEFHDVRTRLAGTHRFVSLHVLVPGHWSVQRGHELCEDIEHRIVAILPDTTVFTHLEPVEDPASHADRGLPRLTDAAARGHKH
ncbi:MAG: cation transporter [candidate division Zixibacteria bacterium]|nr:cation transporter [candidate division Zixibacteria bacterium]